MSIYTVPALSAVDFALTPHTPATITSPTQALASYTVPGLSAVGFAVAAYSPPTYMNVGWELLLAFPTQYGGLRVFDNGAAFDLCLVATSDAPTGMGGQVRVRKGGVTYAAYLVETSDGDASTVRVRTTTGVKAIRRKT